ncbi:MAG: sigma-70 family RNA polymerase sigma factor, partial [Pseudomonadota bacterium]
SLPRLRAFANRLAAGDRALAEDLVQDTCANALHAAGRFTPGTNMRAWLCTILRNRFVSTMQRHGRKAEVGDRDLERFGGVSVPQDGRLAMLDFENTFRDLPAAQREVLVLALLEGRRYAEIAERCHCEVGTVKSRINRARQQLRTRLG